MTDDALAIIGMACRYPEADDPSRLWRNVLSQRRSFRRLPDERLRLADYHSPDPAAPDMVYSTHAAVLEDYEFDRVRHRVSGATYRATDLTHWLALDVAGETLADAGFPGSVPVDRERVGVVLGNTLTGEFSRTSVLRLRWPYVGRVVANALRGKGWEDPDVTEFLTELEREFKAPFAPIGEDSLSGGLSNTIAGRICNEFDFNGGGFTVDGACASSLLAVVNAAQALRRGDLDLVLAGGVDLSLDPFELVGFAKTQALATGVMRVYDRASSGFWPGEGCGIVALARHSDAVAWGARIHALIRGWGVSSDGAGGLTRPERAGQLLALRRAYDMAGYDIGTVALFEGHGTGTSHGDAVELAALSEACRSAGAAPGGAAIGTIKANIGHTKAAAGVAGLIKAVLSVDRQVLPPVTGCENPHAELLAADAPLRVLREPRVWPADRPVRAGVSAMGFGGINTHITVEGATPVRRTTLTGRERLLARTAQDVELIPFAAASRDELLAEVAGVRAAARGMSFGQVRDLATERAPADLPWRAAVLADSPAQLVTRLDAVLAGTPSPGTWLGEHRRPPRIGFLFSGQGSPTRLDGAALARRFPVAAEVFADAGLREPADGNLRDTAVAQPAITTCSVAALEVLRALGVEADAAIGHSLGELTALHWAGVLSRRALLDVVTARGRAMADCPGSGAMLDVAASAASTAELLDGLAAVVAALNGPTRTVVSGEADAIAEVERRAGRRGIRVTRLRVSHAFHSALVAPAIEPLADALEEVPFSAPARQVLSTVTGNALTPDTDVRALLCDQVVRPVRFHPALQRLGETDLLVEVGPGRVLADLTGAAAVDAGAPTLAGLFSVLAQAFVAGARIAFDVLAAGRERPERPALEPRTFLANPCEVVPPAEDLVPAPVVVRDEGGDELTLLRGLIAAQAELPVDAVGQDARLLTELHLNSITLVQIASEAADRLGVRPLDEAVSFADSTVAELAALLAASPPHDGTSGVVSPVVPWARTFTVNWVKQSRGHARTTPCRWNVAVADDHPLALGVRGAFRSSEPAAAKGVVVCLDPRRRPADAEHLLTAVREACADPEVTRLVVVQHGGGGGGIARSVVFERPDLVVRVIDVAVDAAAELLDEARVEAETGDGFAEVRLGWGGIHRSGPVRQVPVLAVADRGGDPLGDGGVRQVADRGGESVGNGAVRQAPVPAAADRNGDSLGEGAVRQVPVLVAADRNGDLVGEGAVRQLPMPAAAHRNGDPLGEAAVLGAGDVLLVTGGGKGIGAEAALALAQRCEARVALLGRSAPDDPEVAATLARFDALGLKARYLSADVTDHAEVAAAVEQVRQDLGEPTAILHAAGTNHPALLRDLDGTALSAALAPKVVGLSAVLDSVEPERLRLLVAFGSVIGEIGMRGEAHYALANDWLRLAVEEAARRLPRCRCRTIEWSVWASAGMGDRLGVLDSLVRRGVMPMSTEDALALLTRIVDEDDLPTTVLVTSRFGLPPTVRFAAAPLPPLRFLEKTVLHYPGTELVVDAELSTATDPYLLDHALGGTPLLPAVTGLEAMAQVAHALTGLPVTGFADVRLARPVTVPESGRTIRLAAVVTAQGVEVALRCGDVDHFRARCLLTEVSAIEPVAAEEASLVEQPDLYARQLFHGRRFQRVRGYRELQARRCVADIAVDAGAAWFSAFLPPRLVLGDFGARDAFIHAAQACVPHRRVLPVAVERIELTGRHHGAVVRAVGVETDSGPDELTYDLTVHNADGEVTERWTGLRLRMVEPLPLPDSWAPEIAAAYAQRRLAELTGRDVRVRSGDGGLVVLDTARRAPDQDTDDGWSVRGGVITWHGRVDGADVVLRVPSDEGEQGGPDTT
ncbi:type I polyketide synthase [Lentzea kentuckyensis]|uniref:type I polyketide synthase n=1 Tax=Lentzea kentuckyensis TaxID=360086 RepID=UPI00117AED6F|nr:type I polyketide synthase [Lentzea kentuckyensis]